MKPVTLATKILALCLSFALTVPSPLPFGGSNPAFALRGENASEAGLEEKVSQALASPERGKDGLEEREWPSVVTIRPVLQFPTLQPDSELEQSLNYRYSKELYREALKWLNTHKFQMPQSRELFDQVLNGRDNSNRRMRLDRNELVVPFQQIERQTRLSRVPIFELPLDARPSVRDFLAIYLLNLQQIPQAEADILIPPRWSLRRLQVTASRVERELSYLKGDQRWTSLIERIRAVPDWKHRAIGEGPIVLVRIEGISPLGQRHLQEMVEKLPVATDDLKTFLGAYLERRIWLQPDRLQEAEVPLPAGWNLRKLTQVVETWRPTLETLAKDDPRLQVTLRQIDLLAGTQPEPVLTPVQQRTVRAYRRQITNVLVGRRRDLQLPTAKQIADDLKGVVPVTISSRLRAIRDQFEGRRRAAIYLPLNQKGGVEFFKMLQAWLEAYNRDHRPDVRIEVEAGQLGQIYSVFQRFSDRGPVRWRDLAQEAGNISMEQARLRFEELSRLFHYVGIPLAEPWETDSTSVRVAEKPGPEPPPTPPQEELARRRLQELFQGDLAPTGPDDWPTFLELARAQLAKEGLLDEKASLPKESVGGLHEELINRAQPAELEETVTAQTAQVERLFKKYAGPLSQIYNLSNWLPPDLQQGSGSNLKPPPAKLLSALGKVAQARKIFAENSRPQVAWELLREAQGQLDRLQQEAEEGRHQKLAALFEDFSQAIGQVAASASEGKRLRLFDPERPAAGLEERRQWVGYTFDGKHSVTVDLVPGDNSSGLGGGILIDGERIGVFSTEFRQDKTLVIHWIGIDEERGLGVGTAVTKWLIRQGTARGLTRFEAKITNPRLLRILYKNRLLRDATVTHFGTENREAVPWDKFYEDNNVEDLPTGYGLVNWTVSGQLVHPNAAGLEEAPSPEKLVQELRDGTTEQKGVAASQVRRWLIIPLEKALSFSSPPKVGSSASLPERVDSLLHYLQEKFVLIQELQARYEWAGAFFEEAAGQGLKPLEIPEIKPVLFEWIEKSNHYFHRAPSLEYWENVRPLQIRLMAAARRSPLGKKNLEDKAGQLLENSLRVERARDTLSDIYAKMEERFNLPRTPAGLEEGAVGLIGELTVLKGRFEQMEEEIYGPEGVKAVQWRLSKPIQRLVDDLRESNQRGALDQALALQMVMGTLSKREVPDPASQRYLSSVQDLRERLSGLLKRVTLLVELPSSAGLEELRVITYSSPEQVEMVVGWPPLPGNSEGISSLLEFQQDLSRERQTLVDTIQNLGVQCSFVEGWQKDSSVRIHGSQYFLIHDVPDSKRKLEGGDVVAFELKDNRTFFLISEGVSFHNEQLLQSLQGKAPFISVTIWRVPHGWFRWLMDPVRKEKRNIDLSHIDGVINAIPRQAVKGDVPVLLVDPMYLRRFTKKRTIPWKQLEETGEIRAVQVDSRERYLNPANFIVLPNHHILINNAPRTVRRLIEAGVREEFIHQTSERVVDLTVFGGSIGCLAGIHLRSAPATAGLEEGAVAERLEILNEAVQGPGVLVIEAGPLSRRIGLAEFVAQVPKDLAQRIVLFGKDSAEVKELAARNGIATVESNRILDLAFQLMRRGGEADRVGFLGGLRKAKALARILPRRMEVVPFDPAAGLTELLHLLEIQQNVLGGVDASGLEEQLARLRAV